VGLAYTDAMQYEGEYSYSDSANTRRYIPVKIKGPQDDSSHVYLDKAKITVDEYVNNNTTGTVTAAVAGGGDVWPDEG
jgi:hypothetical protein